MSRRLSTISKNRLLTRPTANTAAISPLSRSLTSDRFLIHRWMFALRTMTFSGRPSQAAPVSQSEINMEGARLHPRGKRVGVTPLMRTPVCSVPGSRFSVLSSRLLVLSSQFSVLSSRFLILSSRFPVPGSQFSVLSSPHPATRSAIPPHPSVPVAHPRQHSLPHPRT